MGRKKVLCPHGVLGVANCKVCQREQHTARVRELRQKKRELEEQEHALEKEYRQTNPTVVYVNSVQQPDIVIHVSGKATGVSDLKNPERPAQNMAKDIEGPEGPGPGPTKAPNCSNCVRRLFDECFGLKLMERRAYNERHGLKVCKWYQPRRG